MQKQGAVRNVVGGGVMERGGTGLDRAGYGTAASHYGARLLRAIFARELWGLPGEVLAAGKAEAARRMKNKLLCYLAGCALSLT